jgi:hypothetical protein
VRRWRCARRGPTPCAFPLSHHHPSRTHRRCTHPDAARSISAPCLAVATLSPLVRRASRSTLPAPALPLVRRSGPSHCRPSARRGALRWRPSRPSAGTGGTTFVSEAIPSSAVPPQKPSRSGQPPAMPSFVASARRRSTQPQPHGAAPSKVAGAIAAHEAATAPLRQVPGEANAPPARRSSRAPASAPFPRSSPSPASSPALAASALARASSPALAGALAKGSSPSLAAAALAARRPESRASTQSAATAGHGAESAAAATSSAQAPPGGLGIELGAPGEDAVGE